MAYIIPIKFFDAPQVINAAVTPIPASNASPMEVIADTGINVGVGITFCDTTGAFIGVYVGAEGEEILACIIGNGLSDSAWGKFPPHSRVSLRSMGAAIGSGKVTGAIFTL